MHFVDSNVFVHHLAADPAYGQTAQSILERIEAGEKAVTSSLVVIQVSSYLRWKGRQSVVPLFLSLLKQLTSLEKIEPCVLDFEEARDIQLETGLPWSMWDDIVIAAQMKRLNLDEIYSNDKDLQNSMGQKDVLNEGSKPFLGSSTSGPA